jgi:hypothetical protein
MPRTPQLNLRKSSLSKLDRQICLRKSGNLWEQFFILLRLIFSSFAEEGNSAWFRSWNKIWWWQSVRKRHQRVNKGWLEKALASLAVYSKRQLSKRSDWKLRDFWCRKRRRNNTYSLRGSIYLNTLLKYSLDQLNIRSGEPLPFLRSLKLIDLPPI